MADKNIQMTQRNTANNGWDNLFPNTKANNVLSVSGTPLETPEGIMNFSKQSQVSAKRTLTIGMASSGVDYKVFFDVTNTDLQSEFVSSIFKPKQSGLYLITVFAAFNAVVTGNSYVKLYKGGAPFVNIGGLTSQQIINVSRLVYLTAGQSYDFYAVQNSGASQTITSFEVDIVKLT